MHATVKIEKSLFLLDTKSDNKFFFVNVFKKVLKVYSKNQIMIKQANKFEIWQKLAFLLHALPGWLELYTFSP